MNPSRLRYPVVLFDLDGTLLDTVPFILESHQHAWIAHTGRPHDPGRILATIGIPLERSYDDADPALRAAMQATYLAYNKAGNDTHIGIFTGVPRMLDGLARLGVRTGLVTSKRREITERCLRLFDLQDRFGLVVCKEDTARHKPHPDPIHHAMERLGETGINQIDGLTRRAHALQATAGSASPCAWFHGGQLSELGLKPGDRARIRQGGRAVELPVDRDDRLAPGTVRVTAAHPLTAALGARFGALSVEKA